MRQAFDGPVSLLFSCHAGTWGERGDGSTYYARLSSVALLLWLPSFPPQAFPITISSLTSPRFVSLQSTAALALGLLYNPQTPAPGCCTFQGTSVLVWDMYGCGKDCLIIILLRLPQISCFTLRLEYFSSDSENYPDVGIGPLLRSPLLPRAGPALLTLLFFVLLSFVWFDIFFSTGQVLLSPLSWCSACTSVSEGVFLMYHGEKGTPRPPTPRPSCSPRICFSELALHIRWPKFWSFSFSSSVFITVS